MEIKTHKVGANASADTTNIMVSMVRKEVTEVIASITSDFQDLIFIGNNL